jgi:putative drug exporter of the RND superfamily
LGRFNTLVRSETPLLERWTRAMIRFRFVVLGCWLVVAILGALSAMHLPALLSTSLSVPGTSSERADTALAQHFAENPEGTFTVVSRAGHTPVRTAHFLAQQVAAAAAALPDARASRVQRGPGIVYRNVVTRLDLQDAAGYTDTLRQALTKSGLSTAYVTGAPAIQHDLNPILEADLRRGELLALPVALLMLAAVLGLRTVLVVPFVFAGSTISAALAIVYMLAHVILMVSYVPNLVELVGLGLAIDYSLLLVHRFQEEAANQDLTVDDAIVRTMATAGRTVCFSGAAVALGVSVVFIMSVPFIRSLGIAGVVVPVVSIAAALTVQPALLSLFGRGGLKTARLPWFNGAREVEAAFWLGLVGVLMRRRLVVSAGAVVLMAVLAAPAVRLTLTPGSISTIPQFTQSARGLALLREHVGAGALTPIEVVVDGRVAGAARLPAMSAATLRLARRLLQDPEVFVVAIGSKPPYVDSAGRYGRLIVAPRHEFGDPRSQQLVKRLRRVYIPAAGFPSHFLVDTGGAPAQGADFLGQVYGTFPWIVLAMLVLAYLVLLRAFRSLVLPAMALLLDLLSVGATYGLLVVIFQFGAGARLLGLYHTPQIEGWVPVLVFATLFGLSMDYQVFLVTRMREAWDQGADTPGAVAHGVERTGRIVSAAAVIMVASFAGFMAGRVAGLQELGAGLALGVLLDATVVRILLMPCLMASLGRWNWWLPGTVARLLHVEASPLAARAGRGFSRSA